MEVKVKDQGNNEIIQYSDETGLVMVGVAPDQG
jgi:hypothetical protein